MLQFKLELKRQCADNRDILVQMQDVGRSAPRSISRVGGAVIDGIRLTWPLAALTVTLDGIRIETAFGAKYQVRREELRTIRRTWGVFWPCLAFEHDSPHAPQELWFMPWNRGRLIRELRDLGYGVK